MQSSIVDTLESLASWRAELDKGAVGFVRFLAEHELLDDSAEAAMRTLRERLAHDKLVLAFVAEFSRGKSELINAIFFADAGRRVLPATPGRTTMCPVELFHDPGKAPRLALLPIETRLRGLALGELRQRDDAWKIVPLNPDAPDELADTLAAVTGTRKVTIEEATALGFWSDEHPEDNPPLEADGQVEVPAWRHAMINYPHPLLRRGLVVLDTPGLNAIGAEPELTLQLLPSAHATVFVLAADTGVTKSDLAIWREHLAGETMERFVVLNKIDALVDPLAAPEVVQAQIARQRSLTAATLGLPETRVFPLSARQALAARVAGDRPGLETSRLLALEESLTAELLPRQQHLLMQAAGGAVQQMRQTAARRLADRRRQQAEQLLELRGLRGKSGTKVRMMMQRLDEEIAEFERCTSRLSAVRSIQARMLHGVLARLSSDGLRNEVMAMQQSIGFPLSFGAKSAFASLFSRLRQRFQQAASQADELRQMLDASFLQLNAEFGFAFSLSVPPALGPFLEELDLLDRNYSRYLGLSQAWRMAVPGFAEQFRRMLLSKLRVLFENAASELELWSKAATNQIDVQMRERRRGFKRRKESLERIQSAAGELESRLAEVENQDQRLSDLQRQLDRAAESVLGLAANGILASQQAQAA